MTHFVHASATQRRVVVKPIFVRCRRMTAPLLSAILFIFVVAGSINPAAAQTRPFQIRSISFPVSVGSYALDDKPDWTPLPTVIQQIKDLGANDVKVPLSAGVYDHVTDNLPNASENFNPSDAKIVSFLQQLKAAGLQVTVNPMVSMQFDPNGNLLDTAHPQPTDFNVWMAAHSAAMVHFAQLAQQAGADRFIIFADEVQPLTWDPAHQAGWLNMIAQIRAVFSGSLTTLAYDNGTIFNVSSTHIDRTARPILDALDSIGIGWFPQPLTSTMSPSTAQLVAGWRKTVKGVDTVAYMQNVHAKYNKPVWIADMALHSFAGDNMNSNYIFNVQIPLVADQQEQANEYDSLLTVLTQNLGESWFLGVSFDSWNRYPPNWQTARFLDSPYGENIQGKLAEKVLTEWYTGQRSLNYQGLWWKPDEPYWGVNLAHQGDRIFASWYTYDTGGNAYWLSMLADRTPPTGNAYKGDIHADAGPPFDNFVGSGTPTKVGDGTVTFTDANNGSFFYELTAGGATNVSQTKPITRFSLAGVQPTCAYFNAPDLAGATNYEDLWWVPTESGWGVNFAHQGNQLFATWYTYGTNNAPLWLSALMTRQGTSNVFTGPLTRTSGPRFDNYRASDVVQPIPTVGTATASFTDGNHATFAYSTDGTGGLPVVTNQSKSITRYRFAAAAGTTCQ